MSNTITLVSSFLKRRSQLDTSPPPNKKADIFTKPLLKGKHQDMIEKLGMESKAQQQSAKQTNGSIKSSLTHLSDDDDDDDDVLFNDDRNCIWGHHH